MIFPEFLYQQDFDKISCITQCYLEYKTRSVKILKELGAQFNINTLFLSCSRADWKITETLLEQFGLKKSQNRKINSFKDIQFALKYQHMEEYMANMKNYEGNTPLHLTLMNFHKNPEEATKIAECLLSIGANCNMKNREQWTPLHMVLKRYETHAFRWIIDYNARIFEIIENEQPPDPFRFNDTVFNLQKKGGLQKWNIGHLAANFGQAEILQIMGKVDINIFEKNGNGQVPKHVAIQTLTILKQLRQLERKWLKKHILQNIEICKFSFLKNPSYQSNVHQMKIQIEKNMVKKQINMIAKQKIDDDIDISDVSQASRFLFEEKIGSEFSQNEKLLPFNLGINLFSKNQEVEEDDKVQIFAQKKVQASILCNNKENRNSQGEFQDSYQEIIRLMRNSEYVKAIQQIKTLSIQDNEEEKMKMMSQLRVLRFLLNNLQFVMKQQFGKNVKYVLSEFTGLTQMNAKQIKDKIQDILKELRIVEYEISKYQKFKLEVNQAQIKCAVKIANESWSREKANFLLRIKTPTQKNNQNFIALKQRLSNNLTIDISNTVENIEPFMTRINCSKILMLQQNKMKYNKIMCSSHSLILDYERLHEVKFQKQCTRSQTSIKDEENLSESEFIEIEQSINRYQLNNMQFNSPFSTT